MSQEIVEIYVSDKPLPEDKPTSCCIFRDDQGRHFEVFGICDAAKVGISIPTGFHPILAIQSQTKSRASMLFVRARNAKKPDEPGTETKESAAEPAESLSEK